MCWIVPGLLVVATAADQVRRGAALVPQAVVLARICGRRGGAI